MHFGHLLELERTIDDRLERAALEALKDEFHRSLSTGLVAARQPDVVGLDGRHLGDHLQHRQGGDALAERAVEVDDALFGQRRDQLREVWAADRVEGDAGTLERA